MRRDKSNQPKRRNPKHKQDSGEQFHYGFHCVAFLDILGQRRKLRQLPNLPVKDAETTQLLAETAGYVQLIRRELQSCFDAFKQPTGLLDNLPKELQQRFEDAK